MPPTRPLAGRAGRWPSSAGADRLRRGHARLGRRRRRPRDRRGLPRAAADRPGRSAAGRRSGRDRRRVPQGRCRASTRTTRSPAPSWTATRSTRWRPGQGTVVYPDDTSLTVMAHGTGTTRRVVVSRPGLRHHRRARPVRRWPRRARRPAPPSRSAGSARCGGSRRWHRRLRAVDAALRVRARLHPAAGRLRGRPAPSSSCPTCAGSPAPRASLATPPSARCWPDRPTTCAAP